MICRNKINVMQNEIIATDYFLDSKPSLFESLNFYKLFCLFCVILCNF